MQKDFVGNVSHELKTPITSLIGFTETLLDGAKDDPETLTTFLEIMQKEAQRLESLTQEIIQLSKGSEMVYDEEQIQLRPFFNQLIAGYHRIIQEKNLSFHYTLFEVPHNIYPQNLTLQPLLPVKGLLLLPLKSHVLFLLHL